MTQITISTVELKVILSLIDNIKVDTFRSIDTTFNMEHEINAQYAILFRLRIKTFQPPLSKFANPEYIKEVYDFEMIYTDDHDHEVALTKEQHIYACRELENKILITG